MALQYCATEGGYLIEINDEDEQASCTSPKS